MIRAYHATEDPNFRVRDDHAAADLLGALNGMMLFNVIFASLNPMGFFWENISYYRAPEFIAVLNIADDTPNDFIVQGRWFPDEIIITDTTYVTLERLVPVSRCTRPDRFAPITLDCLGYVNPWGSECSNCGRRPVSWDEMMAV